ncbi:hypothetical protein [Streptomyces sp. E1N211]|uniref:hypothetical protein n=1 Tax=Streptomyces sp. E1N211 TaxID=1851876 RepID=UPI0012D95D5D|nr:hypothetical protein [Streptomyces sp. E1N211]
MNGHSITAWRTCMIKGLEAARRHGDNELAERITDELRLMHVALGHRQAGTREEQNIYLMARSTRTPLPELAAVGIDTNEWPPPPTTPTAAHSENASPDTERRITSLFQAAGRLSDHQPARARYTTEHRPQDNQRHRGRLLAWAICDTATGLPVAYHAEKELAEYQADQAAELLKRTVGGSHGPSGDLR